ncbi:MAG: 1-(5-phosphoribosyl)-5-[(5-phosphoribosylamino)methylideneamino]imidazole-4-carboxamide isomerase [Candidatus Hodgkinia cicadicola]
MLFIPAIDVRDSRCVRLYKGRMADYKVYASSALAAVQKYGFHRAELVHVVDLDGAVRGTPQSFSSIREIVEMSDCCVQVGGGIRSESDVELYLKLGVSRVVLGTSVLNDLEFVAFISRRYPGRIAVSIDTVGGLVAVDGWTTVSSFDYETVVEWLSKSHVCSIIWTDVNRDGTMCGINFEFLSKVVSVSSIPVIVSGGVSSIFDIIELKNRFTDGIAGVICGKALYEHTLSLTAAAAVLSS